MSDLAAGSLRGRARVVTAVALVVAVVGGVSTVAAGVKWHRDRGAASHLASDSPGAEGAQATTALAEAGQLAVDFTTYDYRTLDAEFAATAKHATPKFAKTYLRQSQIGAPLLKQAKAVAVSQVVATGLQKFSATKGTATVIVALNVTTKNTKSPAGTIGYYRMRVQLVDDHGEWLASSVTQR